MKIRKKKKLDYQIKLNQLVKNLIKINLAQIQMKVKKKDYQIKLIYLVQKRINNNLKKQRQRKIKKKVYQINSNLGKNLNLPIRIIKK